MSVTDVAAVQEGEWANTTKATSTLHLIIGKDNLHFTNAEDGYVSVNEKAENYLNTAWGCLQGLRASVSYALSFLCHGLPAWGRFSRQG